MEADWDLLLGKFAHFDGSSALLGMHTSPSLGPTVMEVTTQAMVKIPVRQGRLTDRVGTGAEVPEEKWPWMGEG